jgi:hypothetical protein
MYEQLRWLPPLTAEFPHAVFELLLIQGAEDKCATQSVERVIASADAGAAPQPTIDDERPRLGNRVPNGSGCATKTHERQ